MRMSKEQIEKELQDWTNGNRKDIIYLLGQDLLSKDPIAIARAYRMIEETIEFWMTQTVLKRGRKKFSDYSFKLFFSN